MKYICTIQYNYQKYLVKSIIHYFFKTFHKFINFTSFVINKLSIVELSFNEKLYNNRTTLRNKSFYLSCQRTWRLILLINDNSYFGVRNNIIRVYISFKCSNLYLHSTYRSTWKVLRFKTNRTINLTFEIQCDRWATSNHAHNKWRD